MTLDKLEASFEAAIGAMGLAGLEHPVFYHAPVGLRFEIGGPEPVYLETGEGGANPDYIRAAHHRAMTIYSGLPRRPNLLRIDGFPEEGGAKGLLRSLCDWAGLPPPHGHCARPHRWEGSEDEPVTRLALYWALEHMAFSPARLLEEIIRGDLGGHSALTSSVYLVDTEHAVLFHLYDDRGLDVVAADREHLRPLYEAYSPWILDHDRARIDRLFAR